MCLSFLTFSWLEMDDIPPRGKLIIGVMFWLLFGM